MTAAITAAVIGGVAVAGGAYLSSQGAQSAANTQSAASQAGQQVQLGEFNTVQGLLQPYQQAGTGALTGYSTAQQGYQGALGQYSNTLGQLGNITGANGNAAQQTAINGLTSSPLYTSAMQLGQQSILQNASATGGLRGGNTIASLGYLPQQTLANTMNTQISNLGTSLNGTAGLLTGYQNDVGQYGNLVQQGESAAAGTGTAAMSTGNNITSLLGQAGAAQAGATLAGTNATTGAINQAGTLLGGSTGQAALASLMSSAGGGFNPSMQASYSGIDNPSNYG
jgi:hypothetical protein